VLILTANGLLAGGSLDTNVNVSGQSGGRPGVKQVCIARVPAEQLCEFRILSVMPLGDHLQLTYQSKPRSNYVVQAKSDLTNDVWMSLPGTNVGSGAAMQSIVTNALVPPQGFYRIQQLP
jgi:hypothetical protein